MILWPSERSTAHTNCVKKVYRYLKLKCDVADFERKIVADRITDALGHNTKSKLWYICEIKVNWSDLQKAAYQIHDTAFRFKKNHLADTVIPVIAFPTRLYKELIRFDNWDSLRNLCKTMGVAIWVVETAKVNEIYNPKKQASKSNKLKTSTAKKKSIKSSKKNSKTGMVKKKTIKIAKPSSKTKSSKEKTTRINKKSKKKK
jgi:hypothetical protein